ncbi:MAG: DUF2335 domain-containing protein [Tolumonas sp.]|nr:DUF2335 domain-containing protein [Tolumonas sp.]
MKEPQENTESQLVNNEGTDSSNELVERIEGELERNPDVIQRLMERPIIRSMMIAETHQGPLPPARTLAGYEKVLPGAAERVMQMAEKEQAHRHEMQKQHQQKTLELQSKAVTEQLQINKTGQKYGFIIATFVLCLAGLMSIMDHQAVALALVAIDVVGLAAVFVVGRLSPKSEPESKDDE